MGKVEETENLYLLAGIEIRKNGFFRGALQAANLGTYTTVEPPHSSLTKYNFLFIV